MLLCSKHCSFWVQSVQLGTKETKAPPVSAFLLIGTQIINKIGEHDFGYRYILTMNSKAGERGRNLGGDGEPFREGGQSSHHCHVVDRGVEMGGKGTDMWVGM